MRGSICILLFITDTSKARGAMCRKEPRDGALWSFETMSCSVLLQVLGQEQTLAYEPWPAFDESLLISDTFNLPIQVYECFPVSAACVKHR